MIPYIDIEIRNMKEYIHAYMRDIHCSTINMYIEMCLSNRGDGTEKEFDLLLQKKRKTGWNREEG